MTEFRPATKKQLFALYCIYKKDFRNENLSLEEASALISSSKKEDNSNSKPTKSTKKVAKKSTKKEDLEYVEIYKNAKKYADEKIKEIKTTPMVVVQRKNPLDDKSEIVQSWVVDGGLCGFSWLVLKATTTENRKMISQLKKAGIIKIKDGRCNGGDFIKGSESGYALFSKAKTQSQQINTAWINAVDTYLSKHNIKLETYSRLD